MRTSWLSTFPVLTLLTFLLPVTLGVAGTLLPAFGWLPGIGADQLSAEPWRSLFHYPGFGQSLSVTLFSGWLASILALAFAWWLTVGVYQTRAWGWLKRSLSFLLAMPHASFAVGMVFLWMPSGWIMRWLSPAITGFEVPPDWLLINDPWALSLTLVLVLKETPFLLLMMLSALNQLDVDRSLIIGRSLGYSQPQVWRKILWPQIYPALRMPFLAVLAYSLSVVDLAMIVGPTTPPTLSVLVDQWFKDPDLNYRLLGSAGASFIFILVMASIAGLFLLERLVKKITRAWLLNGKRRSAVLNRHYSASAVLVLMIVLSILVWLVLVIWSLARQWRFPDALPAAWSVRYWLSGFEQLVSPLFITLALAALSTMLAIILVVGCLENEARRKQIGQPVNTRKILWLIYLPLIVPQIAFLFGMQTLLVSARMEGQWFSVVWSHLVFVLPYVFLTLSGSYRQFDDRFQLIGVSLSHSHWKTLIYIKWPLLLRPILFSMAVGVAVSVMQYLPTLYVGGGRFTTLTTETVAFASGSDRRILAVFALAQWAVPLWVYGLALLIPAWRFRKFRWMAS